MKIYALIMCMVISTSSLFAGFFPTNNLYDAASQGDMSAVDRYLNLKSSDINATYANGDTALIGAVNVVGAASDPQAVVKKLVEKGANVNAQNDYGATAYDFALHNNYINAAKYLKSRGGKSGMDL